MIDAMKKILVVEDERELAKLLEDHLKDAGYLVTVVHDGETGLREGIAGDYQLIILDLMLPGGDGLEICRALRADPPYTPVLMLTSLSTELDRVLGLEMGADDYMTKPFSIRELVARVKAILRRVDSIERSVQAPSDSVIRIGGLSIDADRRKVVLGGKEVRLTAKEFDLLWFFASNPGRVFTRQQLLDRVWGYSFTGYSYTVNSHINQLRAKLEEDRSHPRYIETVWGVGYRFAEEKGE
ncbi:MAG: response regulator transcription factor [bacterium]|nr:MAG: response regulator transcription factor [bacterium]